MKRIFHIIQFKLLLYGLGVKLETASKKSAAMKEHLANQDFIFQIQTRDNMCGRHFIVRDGVLISRPGVHPDPTFSQIWNDPGEAFKLLLKRDDQVLKMAFDAGKYRLKGDFLVAFWFQEAMKIEETGR